VGVLVIVFGVTTVLLNTPLAFGRYGWFAWLVVVLCAVAVLAAGAAAILYSEFHRAYTFWEPYPENLKMRTIIRDAIVAWVCLTAVFVEIGLLLFAVGLLHTHGMKSYEVSGKLYGLFGWQLGASVPAVDASGTLSYTGPSLGDKGVNGLVLAYKFLVILPAVSVLAELLRRRSRSDRAAGS
jgi:hypothetical protein